jgi:natural product precursor
VKKIAPKKMTLTRETLGNLSDKEMKAILGGALPWTTDSKNACCA